MLLQLAYLKSHSDGQSRKWYEQKFDRLATLSAGVNGVIFFAAAQSIQFFEGPPDQAHALLRALNAGRLPKQTLKNPLKTKSIKRSGLHLVEISAAEMARLQSLCDKAPDFFKALSTLANTSKAPEIEFDPARLAYFKADKPMPQNQQADFFEFCTQVAADEVFLMRSDSQIVYVNQSACNKLGYEKNELEGMRVWEWDPLFPQSVWPGFWAEFVDKKHLHFETQHKKKTGEVFPVEIHAHLYTQAGEPYLLAFVQDIQERKQAEEKLLQYKAKLEKNADNREQHIRTIFELASDGIHVLNQNGDVIECNQAFAKSLGYSKNQALKLNVRDWDVAIPEHKLRAVIKELIDAPKAFQTKHRRKDGSVFDVEVNARGIVLDGEVYLYASSRDITQRIHDQEEIRRLASTDQLTGLSNRHDFMQKFDHYFEKAKRGSGSLALMFFDLDHFKWINDQYGHLVGDEVLIYVADLLKKSCRGTDVVGRFGGDEFVVLLLNSNREGAVAFAEKIFLKLKKPFKRKRDLSITIRLSIGISVFPEFKGSVEELMQKADQALYVSKQEGRDRYSF